MHDSVKSLVQLGFLCAYKMHITLTSALEALTCIVLPPLAVGGARGGAVVETLRCKPEGRRIDSRWCHTNFSLTKSFRPHYGPGVDSASNRNVYQEYFLGVKAASA
jgi:hypothetical protein